MRILIPSRDILFFFVQAAANFPQSFYIGFDLCSWIQLPVKNTTAMGEKHIYWDLFTRISYTYIFYVVRLFAILPPSRWISFSKNNLLYLYELLLNYCSFMRGSGWFSELGCGGVNILCGFILKFQFFFGRGGGVRPQDFRKILAWAYIIDQMALCHKVIMSSVQCRIPGHR